VGRAEWLAASAARVLPDDAAEHDTAVAAISHLPLVLSASLVEAVVGQGGTGATDRPDWPAAERLAATGWTGIDPPGAGVTPPWAQRSGHECPAIAERVRDLVAVLEEWLAVLDRDGGPDEPAIPCPPRDRPAPPRRRGSRE